MQAQLDYGNWIRKKNLYILGACALGTGVLAIIPLGVVYRIVMSVLFLVVSISFLFPLYSYVMFSQNGGKVQEKLYDLIVQKLGDDVKGEIIDIGSGNGVLSVKLAMQNKDVRVTGMDYWGTDWEYSKSVCEGNAKKAGVETRVRFQKGDAAKLDFASEAFDGAVSNLTFHEVKSAKDTRSVVQEALRVVKPGGCFAFIDYFYEEKYYGKQAEFQNFLNELSLSHFECKPIDELLKLPALLKHPRILGRVGILYGRK
jgi:ubiquinone/menaquinone biosynthesis C-methylase UbiE